MLSRLLPLVIFLACNQSPPTTPETRPVENPNAGNTAIYDVDPDDPYEIGDGSFLDMAPGDAVAGFDEQLTPGSLSSGEGTFDVFYIIGRREDTLGFLLTDVANQSIDMLTVTSPDAVTQNGIRVGNTFRELRERLGDLPVNGSEVEARVYVDDSPLYYRLSHLSTAYDIDPTTIPDSATILSIDIR